MRTPEQAYKLLVLKGYPQETARLLIKDWMEKGLLN